MDRNKLSKKLDQVIEKIKDLKDKRSSLLEDEESMTSEINMDPEGFFSDSFKVDCMSNCLYEIEACQHEIQRLEKIKDEIQKKLNNKTR